MAALDIPRLRLSSQGLARPSFVSPVDVVKWLVAVQSQDFAAAKWALGSRMRAATDAEVERAFDDGAILRTHVLRPTWHFVLPADIRWLLALTAPRIKAGLTGRHRQLGLDTRTLKRSNAVLGRALRDGTCRTRAELGQALGRAGIEAAGARLGHVMAWAELEGIVCSGPRKGKQFTYALLDARAPAAATVERDEALAALAGRYFPSRGPATVHDFAKWSGLTLADARRGLEAVAEDLRRDVLESATYWSAPAIPAGAETSSVSRAGTHPTSAARSGACLLSLFDEYIGSYRDRSAIVAPEHATELWAGNAVTHVLLLHGKIVGTWRRRLAGRAVHVELRFFDSPTRAATRAMADAARRYAAFLGQPLTLEDAS